MKSFVQQAQLDPISLKNITASEKMLKSDLGIGVIPIYELNDGSKYLILGEYHNKGALSPTVGAKFIKDKSAFNVLDDAFKRKRFNMDPSDGNLEEKSIYCSTNEKQNFTRITFVQHCKKDSSPNDFIEKFIKPLNEEAQYQGSVSSFFWKLDEYIKDSKYKFKSIEELKTAAKKAHDDIKNSKFYNEMSKDITGLLDTISKEEKFAWNKTLSELQVMSSKPADDKIIDNDLYLYLENDKIYYATLTSKGIIRAEITKEDYLYFDKLLAVLKNPKNEKIEEQARQILLELTLTRGHTQKVNPLDFYTKKGGRKYSEFTSFHCISVKALVSQLKDPKIKEDKLKPTVYIKPSTKSDKQFFIFEDEMSVVVKAVEPFANTDTTNSALFKSVSPFSKINALSSVWKVEPIGLDAFNVTESTKEANIKPT